MDWMQIAERFGVPAVVAVAAIWGIAWLVRRHMNEATKREERLSTIIANHQDHQLSLGKQQVEAQTQVVEQLRKLNESSARAADVHGKHSEALAKLLERERGRA